MSLPRMSWHIGDYKKDTGHLRAAQHGAYFMLCMHYWATGGLPDDDKQLAAIACMSDREWKAARLVIEPLFKGEGKWKHKRIDIELSEAQEKYEKLSKAGRDGNAKRWGGDRHPIPDAIPMASQPITDNPIQVRKGSEANASGADAPRDVRKDLFDRGRKTLETITGRTPDSCRSLLGKWLKAVDEDAIAILGAIEDAERNRIANPVPWIERCLHPKTKAGLRNNVIAAADDLVENMRRWEKNDDSKLLEDLRSGEGAADVRLLSAHRGG